ncbi:MAG: hypothetical protein J6M63_06760 [Pseudobutyrivibrio sp.]|uniref:hypothetical protein n=1 Tax=Pseudobutyrivibrio sp. TaxID=2014367 RepID=UPI001B1700DF|nr:hypothetical protein [Pseudobutyrivibrio sp.]MBO5618301.1 hypothetical protein [Pseudobutyrivibrio sp.]MBO6283616.1 hypothetical protein [Pseudobutyrivibrio sp.]MBP3262034.1 hypothetical protein [Pseudobutyrivibrio sp.]
MKKTYLHIALALAVTAASFVGMAEEAFAKTENVEWNVTYTGKGSTGFESDYTDDIKKQISNAMPGDTLVYTANYKNASDKTMDFFLSADVLSSLEDDKNGKAAVGGAYSYIVTYDSGSGEQIIYDSETVGGDNDVQKGLNQVKNGNAFVSVGTLESNQTGRVKLEVKLDGNSQDNSYMEKLAQLSIQFATTPKTEFDPQNKTIEKKIHKTRQVVYTIPGGSEIVYIDDDEVPLDGGFNPKTGDSILPLLVCAIALVVGIGFIALYFIIEKKSNREVR